MDQVTDLLVGFFTQHPNFIIYMVVFITLNTIMKAVVDSLASSRAQWDKTPLTDDTWYEKALTWSVRVMAVIGKVALYLVGVRSKLPGEKK